ncbi:stage II sporulation protein P [Halobacillus shinanisalinarum]|uniref:Stage II sporulation protein P n=1 Tax=Halobacillus shinanisalinarum TaxID=2932258 RepID=A0ABY4H0W8_9BACI|nr:stage II sporulation protein P [Halobacillus shinanisalinarum]UOQ93794.1 stage II sporulation protein P [Halobacillus shinanisalinarum]
MSQIKKYKKNHPNYIKRWSKWMIITTAMLLLLFIGIGILTGAKSTYRLYSDTIQNFTTQLEGSDFLYLFEMENKIYANARPEGAELPSLSHLSFQMLTSVTPNDPRSLLGREIPGLSSYNSEIIIAGEGTDYTNLPVESQPPLDVVLEDREAVEPEDNEKVAPPPKEDNEQNTGNRDVVFIYSTHNRESFLPHLPDGTKQTNAFHDEVNITKVGERLAKTLEANGVGANADQSDITTSAKDLGISSYDASRKVVKEAMATNDDIKYIFDLHRDTVSEDVTTKEINGETYARTIFVVGAKHPDYEKNLKIATELHKRMEEKYPGLSRGVLTKKGVGVDGKYNQDLSNNAVLVEFGGIHNSLDETYRTADAMAEVFSDYYWEKAEKVSSES